MCWPAPCNVATPGASDRHPCHPTLASAPLPHCRAQLMSPGLGRMNMRYRRVECAPPTAMKIAVMDFVGPNAWLRLSIDVSAESRAAAHSRMLCCAGSAWARSAWCASSLHQPRSSSSHQSSAALGALGVQPSAGISHLGSALQACPHAQVAMLPLGRVTCWPHAALPGAQDTGGRGAVESVHVRGSGGGAWTPMRNTWGVSTRSGCLLFCSCSTSSLFICHPPHKMCQWFVSVPLFCLHGCQGGLEPGCAFGGILDLASCPNPSRPLPSPCSPLPLPRPPGSCSRHPLLRSISKSPPTTARRWAGGGFPGGAASV